MLPPSPVLSQAIEGLRGLARQIAPQAVSFDLADLRGYAYYSAARFSIYAEGASDALVRGGRYDGVGAVFGHEIERDRPAVGFSLDLKQLVAVAAARPLRAAILAPWDAEGAAEGLQDAVSSLRRRGETVVQVLPGHTREIDEFRCDRELVAVAGQWVVQAL